MEWLTGLFGRGDKHEPSLAREEDLPGIGRVHVACVIDCMGAVCPRPQLLIIKILAQVGEGDVIEIVSDNPAAVEAFPFLAEALLCSHLLTLRERDCWRLYLRKGFA